MERTVHEVREYHLYGEGLHVVFHQGDADGMKLIYNDKEFSGRALYREKTVMGLVVSVLVESIPDHPRAFFTLVVPEAHRPDGVRSIEVLTFAVLSTKQTAVAGSEVAGQVDRYEVVRLKGNAW